MPLDFGLLQRALKISAFRGQGLYLGIHLRAVSARGSTRCFGEQRARNVVYDRIPQGGQTAAEKVRVRPLSSRPHAQIRRAFARQCVRQRAVRRRHRKGPARRRRTFVPPPRRGRRELCGRMPRAPPRAFPAPPSRSSSASKARATKRPPPSCAGRCAVVQRRALVFGGEQAKYGGVVPEIASRAHVPTSIGEAVRDRRRARRASGMRTSTRSPSPTGRGCWARCSSGCPLPSRSRIALGVPLIAVNHIRGHMAAAYLADAALEPPFITLLACGGHTAVILYTKSYTES